VDFDPNCLSFSCGFVLGLWWLKGLCGWVWEWNRGMWGFLDDNGRGGSGG
jgi:hypothetical protein